MQREHCEELGQLLGVDAEEIPASSLQVLLIKHVQQHDVAVAAMAASARDARAATHTLQQIAAFWAAEATLIVAPVSPADPVLSLPDADDLQRRLATDLATVADLEAGPFATKLDDQLAEARQHLCDTQRLLQCWCSCGRVQADVAALLQSDVELARCAAAQAAQTRGVALRLQGLLEHLGPESQLGQVVKDGDLFEVRDSCILHAVGL